GRLGAIIRVGGAGALAPAGQPVGRHPDEDVVEVVLGAGAGAERPHERQPHELQVDLLDPHDGDAPPRVIFSHRTDRPLTTGATEARDGLSSPRRVSPGWPGTSLRGPGGVGLDPGASKTRPRPPRSITTPRFRQSGHGAIIGEPGRGWEGHAAGTA